MPEEEDFLANVAKEGDEPFKEQDKEEKETPPAPPAEAKPEEEKSPPSQGEKKEEVPPSTEDDSKLPFHKHPRWKQMFEDNETLKQQVEELSRFKEEVTPLLEEGQKRKSQEVPDWFTEVFGDNQAAWNKFEQYNKEQQEQIRTQILQEIESERVSQQTESKKWSDWVETSLVNLGEEVGTNLAPGTAEKQNNLRNELLKVMADYRPSDEQGNLDFKKGYEILQRQKELDSLKSNAPAKSEERKKIASSTTSGSQAEEQPKGFVTWAETRKRGFFGG